MSKRVFKLSETVKSPSQGKASQLFSKRSRKECGSAVQEGRASLEADPIVACTDRHRKDRKMFVEVVEKFLRRAPEDYLIGIHCTHGVNRTGYLVVRYMIERMGYSPQIALNAFLRYRGHAIERTPYIADLLRRGKNNK